MSRSKNKLCYFCGKPAISMEHIPPRQLFKGFSYDSMTVPSCSEHNNMKSGLDQAILSTFLRPFLDPKLLRKQPAEMRIALAQNFKTFQRTKNISSSQSLISDYKVSKVGHLNADINQWIKQLTAGLICWVIKKRDKK